MRSIDRLLAKLSRVTPSGGSFVPEMDGLRFFAITSVIALHIAAFLPYKDPVGFQGFQESLLGKVLSQGGFGVELFFVISGFVLALPFAASLLAKSHPHPSLGKYYARRVLRLEPPYFINLLLFFSLWVIVREMGAKDLFPHLLASLGYVHYLVYQAASRVNGVAWSLEVEVQFYLLAPFIAQAFRIQSRLLRIATLIVLPIIVALVAQRLGVLSRSNLTGNLQYFLVGFLLVDIFLVSDGGKPQQSYVWDVVSSGAWLLIVVCLVEAAPYAAYYLPLLVLAAYVGAFRGVIWNAIARNRWLVTIGGMCYTIYLYHCLVVSAVGRFTVQLGIAQFYWLNLILQFMLLFLSVLTVCAVLFVLFEKPFMYKDWPARWRKMFLGMLIVPQRGEPKLEA